MKPQKDSFQDRVGRAAEAKQKALDQLKAKPPLDEAALARRAEERAAREAVKAEAAAAKQRQVEEAAAERAAAERAAAEAAEASVLSESERKAARDARYAARKNRK